MAGENYPDEVTRDTVAFHRDTDGATITQIAVDLGFSGVPPPGTQTPAQELAKLRAENTTLRANEVRLSTERNMLRSAATYAAGKTSW